MPEHEGLKRACAALAGGAGQATATVKSISEDVHAGEQVSPAGTSNRTRTVYSSSNVRVEAWAIE